MTITSASFLAAVMIVSAIIFFLPRGLPRQILLAVCNAAFLSLSIPNLTSAVVMAVFVLSGFFVAEIMRQIPNHRARPYLLASYLVGLLFAFVVLKEYAFLSFLIPPGTVSRWVSLVGLSYILFRQIHYVVDVSEGQIEQPSLWTYLNYQFDLFALYSGPIQRYQHFNESWGLLAPILNDAYLRLRALARIMLGVIKIAAVSTVALKIADHASSRQLHIRSPRDCVAFAELFYAYPAYIYFNFSGYCDIVIAGAAFVGIDLPENFNHPYLARNAIDFWGRWHMTLTHWIRDYVFTPMYKKGVENNVVRPQRLSYACYFIALFLAGLWHGSTANFAIFGLLHGAGVSVTKMWEERILRRRGRPGLREYLKSRPIYLAATVLTFHFVCFTFLFFPSDLSGRASFLRRFLFERPSAVIATVATDKGGA
jgi:D-alanyl-lipoteichoic acid acyltransferase DltB (MBOAT superfamily)